MPLKRINMSVEDELLFEKLKKKYKMTNDETLSFCVRSATDKMNESEIIKKELKKTLEYVKLLVKVNKELPTLDEKEQMNKVVHSTSRFEEMIEEKIEKGANKK